MRRQRLELISRTKHLERSPGFLIGPPCVVRECVCLEVPGDGFKLVELLVDIGIRLRRRHGNSCQVRSTSYTRECRHDTSLSRNELMMHYPLLTFRVSDNGSYRGMDF